MLVSDSDTFLEGFGLVGASRACLLRCVSVRIATCRVNAR